MDSGGQTVERNLQVQGAVAAGRRLQGTGRLALAIRIEVLDANGKRESSGSLQAPASGDGSLYLQIPLDRLPAGVHTLVVRGGSGGEIVSWSRFHTSR